MPAISIIIPVYNVEKYLKKCLRTILNQSFTDFEVICVNDGSKDNSLDILNEFALKDSRIKIVNQENQGPSLSRNNGMKVATGEYVCFVDSDDWLDLNFVEKLYSAIKKYDADIAVCSIKRHRIYKWKYHLKIQKEEYTEDTNRKFVICDVPEKCYVWNKLYKLSELKKHELYFEPNVYYEDRCFTVNALIKLKKLVSVPNVYYNYRTNGSSIVKTKSEKKSADDKYTYKKMMDTIQSNNICLDHYPYDFKSIKTPFGKIVKIKCYKNYNEYLIFNFIKFKTKNKTL